MIDTAVILAAGRGTRLREMGSRMPKGFIRLGERPIVEESLTRLDRAGIRRTLIVTGHLDGFYRELAGRLGGRIAIVHNARYAESGSLYSLFVAREALSGRDFLVLESDLTYEQRALSALTSHSASDVVLVSGPTASGDEVLVEAEAGRLVNMSKRCDDLGSGIIGEFVGVSRISPTFFDQMLACAETRFRRSLFIEYEQGLVAAATDRPVQCQLIPDLLWAEIDDATQLARALNLVYPRIVARDAASEQ